MRTKEIILAAHIDGVKADKSSGLEHWPILMKIINIDENIIFPVALNTNIGKPSNLEDYFREFVAELDQLSTNGLSIHGNVYKIKLIRILGDAPARCFFLNTIQQNGKQSCLYCDVKGEWVRHRVHFYISEEVRSGHTERTEEEFYQVKYHPLQHGRTPLMDIQDFNILLGCPYDPMHVLFNGIMDRLLEFLVHVDENKERAAESMLYKLKPSTIEVISDHLLSLKDHVPVEFQRKTAPSKKCKSSCCTLVSFREPL